MLDGYAGTASAGVACMSMGLKYTGLLGIIKISISCRRREERAILPSRAVALAQCVVWCQVNCDLQRFAYNVQRMRGPRIQGGFGRDFQAKHDGSFLCFHKSFVL